MSQTDAWKLPRAGERCAHCEGPLLAGAPCTTVIRLLAAGPTREDLCAVCGEAAVAASDVCFWRRRRPESARQHTVVDFSMLRELFGRMLQRPDEVYGRLSYLVALVLIRKRHLRLVGFERRAGREVMVVSRGAGQPHVDVPAPLLDAAHLLAVREQLARLLNTDLQDHDLPELASLRPADGEAGVAVDPTGPAEASVPAPGAASEPASR